MEQHAIATLVREAVTAPPGDPVSSARLAARAAELGVPATFLHDLQRLWTPRGWVPSQALQADAAPAVIWN